MTDKIKIEVTPEQAKAISEACDIMSRLLSGQVKELVRIWTIDYDQARAIKRIAFPQLPSDGNYGVMSHCIPDKVRQMYDIHQVIRHFLAWEEQDNAPENRDWSKQMTVDFDEPSRTSSEQELPRVTK